ncbi:hypothetical protein NliqN6_6327 [Naganishia liquefaciens]|uniref:Uncharacterized protein n=1 Tax=Naganishia liquefaciens TaxID=104408 RepID=A0A8H3TZW5_9TREE|nr:hypothetical protein NliqN6_6327 [Naganishia liquefaciens]
MDATHFYIPNADLPARADPPLVSKDQAETSAPASDADKSPPTKSEGIPELLQALRDALQEDTQTAAFKQLSQMQQAIQAQEILLRDVTRQKTPQPMMLPPVRQEAIVQSKLQVVLIERGLLISLQTELSHGTVLSTNVAVCGKVPT